VQPETGKVNVGSSSSSDSAAKASDLLKPVVTEPRLTHALAEPTGVVFSEQDTASDFAEWMNDNKNQNVLRQVGSFDPSAKVVSFNAPVTLSFSAFAKNGPLLIKTNGHDITLVGHDFSYLKIDTSKQGGHSGHLRLYSTAKELPAILTAGTSGSDGAQGTCPADVPCAGVGEPVARRPFHGPSIASDRRLVDYEWDWSDSKMPEVLRNQVLALQSKPSDSFFTQYCGSAIYSYSTGPFITGRVKLKQVIFDPVMPSDLASAVPVDAALYSGSAGGTGFDGGNVTVIQLGEEDKSWMESSSVRGGLGGIGGRHFMSPASEEAIENRQSSFKLAERLQVSNLSAEYRVNCIAMSGRFPHSFMVSAVLPSMNLDTATKTEILNDGKSVALPAVAAGRDLPSGMRQRAENGESGRSGQREIIRAQTLDQWKTALHPSIPIPQKIQTMTAGQ
jgi:hypothetical protein